MSTDEVQRVLKNVLDRFDVNGDAQITWEEFAQALTNEGLDAATMEAIRSQVFSNWDKDRNNTLSPSEIRSLAETWAGFPGDQSTA